MSEFDDKLSAILGDQNAMSQIMALAQSLSGPKQPQEDGTCEEAWEEKTCIPESSPPPDLLPCQGQDVQLLSALRPYLKDSRQKKLDKALELLQLLRMLRGTGL